MTLALHGESKRRRGWLIAIAVAVVALATVAGGTLRPGGSAQAAGTAVYDAIPNPLPPNVASLGFQATSTSEFGDYVHLAGTDRILSAVTVTMSDWALYSTYSSDPLYSGNSATWSHPITLNIYASSLDEDGVPDTLLATTTQNVTIPWRPEASVGCGTAWLASDAQCYNGFAFNITFDMSSLNVTLPDEVIVGVAYNTQSYGLAPIGVAGPYNSLNVGVPGGQTASVGTDDNDDNVFWNTAHAPFYADGGTGGVGVFREDTAWTPNGTVAIQITAEPDTTCTFTTVDMTMTLDADCTTDATILIPNGFTLDGDSHTITAVDPVGGHFLGAVVKNGGAEAHVTNLTVTASGLANVCDGAGPPDNRLRGILFDGAAGSITNNVVTDVNQGPSGCQEGNAIEVRNAPFDNTGTDLEVLIDSNEAEGYIKNGITASGSVTAIITNNVVTGSGPVGIPLAAQNGIQVGFGATAIVEGNIVSDNSYTPDSWLACGLLFYEADGVRVSRNFFSGNERNVCNYGRGGGESNPNP